MTGRDVDPAGAQSSATSSPQAARIAPVIHDAVEVARAPGTRVSIPAGTRPAAVSGWAGRPLLYNLQPSASASVFVAWSVVFMMGWSTRSARAAQADSSPQPSSNPWMLA